MKTYGQNYGKSYVKKVYIQLLLLLLFIRLIKLIYQNNYLLKDPGVTRIINTIENVRRESIQKRKALSGDRRSLDIFSLFV